MSTCKDWWWLIMANHSSIMGQHMSRAHNLSEIISRQFCWQSVTLQKPKVAVVTQPGIIPLRIRARADRGVSAFKVNQVVHMYGLNGPLLDVISMHENTASYHGEHKTGWLKPELTF